MMDWLHSWDTELLLLLLRATTADKGGEDRYTRLLLMLIPGEFYQCFRPDCEAILTPRALKVNFFNSGEMGRIEGIQLALSEAH